MAGGKAGKDSGKTKQKAVSRSARAGLQFPVGRCVTLIFSSAPLIDLEWADLKRFFQDPPSPQVEGNLIRQSWSHCSCLQLGYPWVSHRWGAWVGRERIQGSQGEEDHSETSPAGHPWWRGAGHLDQGNHCWRRGHPPHPQVADRKEGRGHPATPVEKLHSANSTKSSKMDNLTLVGQIWPNPQNWPIRCPKCCNARYEKTCNARSSKNSTTMQAGIGSLFSINNFSGFSD